MLIIFMLLIIMVDTSSCFPLTINYNVSDCYDNSTYTLKSSYETNLNDLLSTLVSQISNTKNGFITHKQASQNGQVPAYGLALCRGDLNPQDCHGCVDLARKEVVNDCPSANQAILWKEQCMIRYSNISFFSQLQTQPNMTKYDTQNVTGNVEVWEKFRNDTLNNVASMAASNVTGKMYATKEEVFNPTNMPMNTLAQCTPDLTMENCYKCLRVAIDSLMKFDELAIGEVALTPSCTLRYDHQLFYQISSLGQSPLPSLTPPNNITTKNKGKKKKPVTKILVAIIVPLAVLGMIIVLGTYHLRKKAKKYPSQDFRDVLDDLTTAESLTFELRVLENATNNFSDEQKLGQGGFGSVYKGTLRNGQEIAVKRLSKISSQGVGEFKNEVVLIANLQHRNLVKLLGFCLAGEEKLLVYEFVPNKSLNYFLFGEGKQSKLNWPMRYNIIKGIARGLLYLHEDSRPRIIHRDLKSDNILLDENMNPKISDFGLARIFKVEQTEDNTNRVVGTYGYMSPEYAMHGQFSIKSDVYSFGVLVLEIISGKKITARFHPLGPGDLLTNAWTCLTEQKLLEFMDPTLQDSYTIEEVMRCVHLGLLCAQDNANERPTMSSIVLMLNNDYSTVNTTLPTPLYPRSHYNISTESSVMSRLSRHSTTTMSTSNSHSKPLSENQDTVSNIYPR